MVDEEDIRNEPSDDEEDHDERDTQIVSKEDMDEDRNEELCGKREIKKAAEEIFKDVDKGFSDQWERSNATMDYWDIVNCNLGAKQFYNGNSKIYVPIVHDAVEARKTRFTNQIFPVSGKHVEVTASEDKPRALMSLLEHYIRKTKLRTKIMPALCKNGDVEGQYTIVVGWRETERHVAMRVKKKPTVDAGGQQVQVEGEEEFDDIKTEEIKHSSPTVEIIADNDVLVLPATADSVEGAIDDGGSATIIRRWSKAKIRKLIQDEEIDKKEGQDLIAEMVKAEKSTQTPNKKKNMLNAAGIQGEGGLKRAQVFETWTKLKVDGERRICRIYYGGEKRILSVKRNPYWCDKIPILSAPVEKIEGSFKGVKQDQVRRDTSVRRERCGKRRHGQRRLRAASDHNDRPAEEPARGLDGSQRRGDMGNEPEGHSVRAIPAALEGSVSDCIQCQGSDFSDLGVNPAMMPQQVTAPGKKPNQAQIANEQQVDILTTADAVTTLEGEILTPMLQWFVWLDHQYRDKDLLIPAFGRDGDAGGDGDDRAYPDGSPV